MGSCTSIQFDLKLVLIFYSSDPSILIYKLILMFSVFRSSSFISHTDGECILDSRETFVTVCCPMKIMYNFTIKVDDGQVRKYASPLMRILFLFSENYFEHKGLKKKTKEFINQSKIHPQAVELRRKRRRLKVFWTVKRKTITKKLSH